MRFIASDEPEAALLRLCDRHFNETAAGRPAKAVEHAPDEFISMVFASFTNNVFEGVVRPAGRTGKNVIGLRISRSFERHVAACAKDFMIRSAHSVRLLQ